MCDSTFNRDKIRGLYYAHEIDGNNSNNNTVLYTNSCK